MMKSWQEPFLTQNTHYFGVGHETDYTICDFVADERAITPTAAGERIGYDILKLKIALKRSSSNQRSNVKKTLMRPKM